MRRFVVDSVERLHRSFLHGPSKCRAGCGACLGSLLATLSGPGRRPPAALGAAGALAIAAVMLLLPIGRDLTPWREQAALLASQLATVGPQNGPQASALAQDLALLGYAPPPGDEDGTSDSPDETAENNTGGGSSEQETSDDSDSEDRSDSGDRSDSEDRSAAGEDTDRSDDATPTADARDSEDDESSSSNSSADDSEAPSSTRAPAASDDDAEETSAGQTPAPRPSAEDGAGSSTVPDPGAMPEITVQGDQILRDGEAWWFLGYNSFVWSGDCGNDDEKMSADDVEQWFSEMRHDGHGAVRLFFYDGWDIDRLDAAVDSAKRHNVYLTITLDDAIGGCGENDKDAGWFADQSERDVYQAHMEMLLERYRGETAFAWFEFFNEPSYEGGALREFFDEMGEAADAVDPGRLFASGTVAPYWLDGEDNFADVHESPGVDIASMHEYDEGEVESNHGPGVRANSGGKPVIVGEYGITAGEGCDSGFDSRADRITDKAEAYTSIDGYVGAFAWAWQPGGGGCELGNLDADTATQDVLREFAADPTELDAPSENEQVGLDTPDQDTADESWQDVARELADSLAALDDPDARELADALAEAGFGDGQGESAEPSDSTSPPDDGGDDTQGDTDGATTSTRRPA